MKLRPKRLLLLDCKEFSPKSLISFLASYNGASLPSIFAFSYSLSPQGSLGSSSPFYPALNLPPEISRLVFGLLLLQHDSDQLDVNFRKLFSEFGAKVLKLLYFLVIPDSARRFVKMLNGPFVHLPSSLGFSNELVV